MALLLVVMLSLLAVWPVGAKEIYVDKDGVAGAGCNDRNAGTKNAPVCSCTAGTALLSSGDTLYLRGGTYQGGPPEYCYWYADPSSGYPPVIPSGQSWATATTIAAYPGERVVLQGGGFTLGWNVVPAESYLIFDRLHIENGYLTFNSTDHTEDDGTEHCFPGPRTTHHIRFQNGSLYQSVDFAGAYPESATPGIMIGGCGNHIEFLNNDLYNAGGGTAGQNCADPYGCYAAYVNFKASIFDGNRIYDNAGYGLHLFSSDHGPGSGHIIIEDNVVSNNVFWNNGFWDLRSEGNYGGGWAFICCSGPRNKVYNNIVFGNWSGIQIDYVCDECEIYNNTSYANEEYGIAISNSRGVQVKNNIAIYNKHDIGNFASATEVGNWTTSHGDPRFVNGVGKACFGHNCHFDNARSADFHLRGDSPVKNSLACLTGFSHALAHIPPLTTDFTNAGWANSPGLGRPQPSGGRCEPGAYEFQEGIQPACPPDCPPDERPTVAAIFVDSNGAAHGTTPSDSNSCQMAETISTPKATLASALACMTVPCKHLVLRGGTHAGFVDTGATALTGGPDWSCPTVMRNHAAEVPVVQLPVTHPGGVLTFRAPATDAYIEVRGLTLDGMSRADGDGILVNGSSNLRFKNLTIRNNHYSNVTLINSSDIEILTSTLTNALGWASVVLYGTANTVLVSGNTITSAAVGGVNLDPSAMSNSVTITKNTLTGVGTGIAIGPGTGAVVTNNLIREQSGDGIHIHRGAQRTKVYHNDTVSNAGTGILCDSGAGTTAGIDLKNNITVANTAAQLVAHCTLMSGGDQGNTTTGTLAALFTNAGAGDYSLKTSAPASPAIDAGVRLTAVTDDILGNARPFPAGGLPDAGAYESQSVPVAGPTMDMRLKVMGMFF
jgi:Right handed beta helix region